MAKTSMVTRTIQTTVCTVLCLDIQTAEPENKTVVLPRTYKDEAAMMRVAEKMLNTDTLKAVHVVDSHVESALYGMTEVDFIKAAKLLPSRVKAENAETDLTDAPADAE